MKIPRRVTGNSFKFGTFPGETGFRPLPGPSCSSSKPAVCPAEPRESREAVVSLHVTARVSVDLSVFRISSEREGGGSEAFLPPGDSSVCLPPGCV